LTCWPSQRAAVKNSSKSKGSRAASSRWATVRNTVETLGLERDIDVLFLGDVRVARRRRALDFLQSSGINVTVAGSWEDPQYWGENRTKLLNRTKILLNIPRTAGDYSGLRMFLGAANGAVILSEPFCRDGTTWSGVATEAVRRRKLAAGSLPQNRARPGSARSSDTSFH
jgi:hypothetical protein